MPIHDKLIRALSSLVSDIYSDMSSLVELEKLVRDINAYSITHRARGLESVVASDSSRVYREMRAGVLFAVQAVGVKLKAGEERVNVEAEAGYCTIPLTSGKTPVEEVVKRAAQFTSRELELSVASSLSSSDELVLHDGSLFSFLWYGKLPEIPREFKFASGKKPRKLRDMWRSVATRLVEAAQRSQLLFLAKTIRRNYYVEKLLPDNTVQIGALNDIVVLELLRRRGSLPRAPFFIEPLYIEKPSDLPRPLKSLDPEDMEFIKPVLPVTVTYVAFGPTTPLYQLTAPGKLSTEDLSEVLNSILAFSATGYPDPLKIAHSMSKISIQEFKALAVKLGLTRIPTGRELLGEFM
ncbi:MAG: DNA double-strand break repair nuclease NurA [Desulfurococcaceae archaeon]|jgi:hypothetical protein|nr:DNA double-strand break repair nuclease NurA [Desulfurococcaceae archaeon]